MNTKTLFRVIVLTATTSILVGAYSIDAYAQYSKKIHDVRANCGNLTDFVCGQRV